MCSASAGAAGVQLDGLEWLPVITQAPSSSQGYSDSSGELGPLNISLGTVSFRIGKRYGNLNWNKLAWTSAPFTLWIGEVGKPFPAYRQLYIGTLSGLARSGSTAQLALRTVEGQLDVPALSARYAGTGAAEGSVDAKGPFKPRAHGYCLNVTPVEVDPALLVYQVHGYGAVEDIPAVYEFAQSLAAKKADVADWAALAAYSLQPGEWISCNALGLFRLGGRPDKKLTADVKGGAVSGVTPTTAQGIITQLLKEAGVSSARIGDLSALNYPWCVYLTDQKSIADLIKQAAQEVGGYLLPDSNGVWQCGRYRGTKTPVQLQADRTSEPLVQTIEQVPLADPVWKVEVGYDPCWTVHDTSDISPALQELEGKVASQDDVLADLAEQADQAQADAASALAEAQAISADGILNRSDKRAAVDRLEKERVAHTQLSGEYGAYNVATQWSDYDTKFNALDAYLTGLAPSIYDNSANTPVDRTTYLTKWGDYETAKQVLLNAITGRTAQTAYWPNVTGPGVPESGATKNVNRGVWVPAAAYAVGDFFTYGGSAYSVTTAHISSAGSPPPNANVALLAAQGASAFTLKAGANVTVTPNSIVKSATGNSWNAGAYSLEGYIGDVEVTAQINDTSKAFMIGLNSDPTTDDGPYSLDYAMYCYAPVVGGNGHWLYYENAGAASGVGPVFANGDTIRVRRRGTTVEYSINGDAPFRTTTGVNPNTKLYLDSALNTSGATIENITFKPVGADGAPGLQGLKGDTGLPGAPGVDGKTPYTHFAFADSANGVTNFTTGAPGNRYYIGIYSDFTAADSTNPASYTWTLLRGADGANGIPGPPGANGQATYSHIAYATNSTGTAGFSTTDGTNKTYIGTYTDGTLADSNNPAAYTWSLIKGADGINGQDGKTFSVSTTGINVAADYLGTAKASQFPITFSCKLVSGSTDISSSATFTVTATAGNNAAKASSLIVSISSVTTSGYIDVRCQYGSFDQTIRVPVNMTLDNPPAQQGNVSQTTNAMGAFNSAGSTSYPANPVYVLNVRPNGSGQLNFQYGYHYAINPPSTLGTRSARCATKVVYRVAGSGGTWLNATSEVVAGPASSYRLQIAPGEQDTGQTEGNGSENSTVGGFSPSSDYEVGMMVRNWGSDSVGVVSLFGSFTAKQP